MYVERFSRYDLDKYGKKVVFMICKQRRMRHFSALVRGIVKTAANRNGRQFNDFGLECLGRDSTVKGG